MTKRRLALVWCAVAAWAAASVVASLAHVEVWRLHGPPLGEGESAWTAAAKLVTNVTHLINGPVWFASWQLLGAHRSFATAFVANGVGFALWVFAVFIGWRLWRAWRAPISARREASVPNPAPPRPGISRRQFLIDGAGAAAALSAGSGAASATLITPWSIRVTRYTLALPGLPVELDGLRLAQVTDTHLGPRIPESHVAEAVRIALALKPDMVILTGDYVHNSTLQIEHAAQLLAPLASPGASPIGAVGVLGNHDHYVDAPRVRLAMVNAGVRMIDNDRVYIDASTRRLVHAPPASGLCIAGVGDLYRDVIDLDRALRDAPHGMPRLLLSHNPDVAEMPQLRRRDDAARGRVDAMICGHTHGGQVRLPLIGAPGVPSRFGQKYASGFVQGPVCSVIVCTGIGMSVAPIRIGVPPEVVEITLARALPGATSVGQSS